VPKSYDLTTTVVAIRLGVSRQTLTRWVQSGELEALRTPGGHLRFNHEDVEVFAAELVVMEPSDGAA
jgi:excisionase family DNA binding protein